jgi:pimeloyl-ACP methyl ester carboxylesterase
VTGLNGSCSETQGVHGTTLAIVDRNARGRCLTPDFVGWGARASQRAHIGSNDHARYLEAPAVVAWARSPFPKLDAVPLGSAGHHAPEDPPKEIAGAITSWLGRHALR